MVQVLYIFIDFFRQKYLKMYFASDPQTDTLFD